jgi:tRNA 2-thiouridine synthesizing protein A
MRRIAVVVETRDPAHAAEAIRAAVGLTLRGDRVHVVPRAPLPEDARSQRALATLRAMGHEVGPLSGQPDVVEVWSDADDAFRRALDAAPAERILDLLSGPHGMCPPTPAEAGGAKAGGAKAGGAEARGAEARGAEARGAARGEAREPTPPPERLDLRGEICPFTFVRTKLRLEALPLGARLLVSVDHEPATRNIPRSAAEWGQKVLSVTPSGPGRWDILIEKGKQPA